MEQEFEDIDSESRWQSLYLVSKAKRASMLMSHAIYSGAQFLCLFLNAFISVSSKSSSLFGCLTGEIVKVKLMFEACCYVKSVLSKTMTGSQNAFTR